MITAMSHTADCLEWAKPKEGDTAISEISNGQVKEMGDALNLSLPMKV